MGRSRSPHTTLQSILCSLFREHGRGGILDPARHLGRGGGDRTGALAEINAAFAVLLAGPGHPDHGRARGCLADLGKTPVWSAAAEFYNRAPQTVAEEVKAASARHPDLCAGLERVASRLKSESPAGRSLNLAEQLWTVFCPEACGIIGSEMERVEELRSRRTLRVERLNPRPPDDPWQELLFTSNVLLTTPLQGPLPARSRRVRDWAEQARRISCEPQAHWYDHPIPLGVDPAHNEVLYGLRGLDETCGFELKHSRARRTKKLTCILSVSVTHAGLHGLARPFLEEELRQSGGLRHLDCYIMTESDCREILDAVLAPAAERLTGERAARELLDVFGVDGEYGRHYSFLKAIAAFWQVLIRPSTAATFKIDLDQVFPQKQLLEETGVTAFGHLQHPLWGALARDTDGKPIELGMIAGSLVNQRDIDRSIFTPDVPFPPPEVGADEFIFHSALPQALSTEAEMMTRYQPPGPDGKRSCVQRVHVTGGTTGILVDSLRRHRPFTPSFIGRAEDQAYILSVLDRPGRRLGYVHAAGLIMRHDKESFAREAIQTGRAGKWIGDYVRLLNFSSYAAALDPGLFRVKKLLDPFTGCFISRLPVTVTMLRFVLKTAALLDQGESDLALEFQRLGLRRIEQTLSFATGPGNHPRRVFERERTGWELYYETLKRLEEAIAKNDAFCLRLRERAAAIVERCRLRIGAVSD